LSGIRGADEDYQLHDQEYGFDEVRTFALTSLYCCPKGIANHGIVPKNPENSLSDLSALT
jgi:hypothetical protein